MKKRSIWIALCALLGTLSLGAAVGCGSKSSTPDSVAPESSESVETPEISEEPEISEVIIASYSRKKTTGKRDTDLEGLPARIIEHRLSEEELKEKFPHGYKELPHEVYRRLHIIPETFIVDEHHVHVYASKNNDGTIVKAPRSTDLVRNSITNTWRSGKYQVVNSVYPGQL